MINQGNKRMKRNSFFVIPLAGQFFQKRWFLCTGIVIVLWTFLLLYIQGATFCPSYTHDWVLQKFLVRVAFDLLFTSFLVLAFPRVLVLLLILLSAVCGLNLIIYARTFHETMSVLSLFNNFQEGTTVISAIVALIPLGIFFLFLAVLILCGVLLFLAGQPPFSYRFRLAGSGLCLLIYLMQMVALTHFNDLAFHTLTRFKVTGDLTVIYGYIPVWTAEFFLKNESTLCKEALKQPQTDRLTPLETPLKIPRQIVVIQVESLDFTILDREFNGKIITPFLNELKKKSFFYKVNTFHYNGSADADFAFLARREPSRHLLNYKIKTYPYDDALPHKLHEHGYHTYSFHNNNRLYFNRYSVFQKMGFTEIYFIEELKEKYHLQTSRSKIGWNTVQDDVLFRIVSENVCEENNKSFFFAITLFGHVPFTAITEKDIFPNPVTLTHYYVNSVHVLDRQFRVFYESLPAGTMVIVYGDHSSNITSEEYTSRDSDGDYTPCMISIVGESIANQQKTDPLFALSGQLSLVDISNYLWKRVQK
jgi:phosphoglycerol transferase MdoB-like AlkP superfamily enzyme